MKKKTQKPELTEAKAKVNVEAEVMLNESSNGAVAEIVKLIGKKVKTPDGVGILLNKKTPFNGLYFEDDKTEWTVWYGDNPQNGWISRTYYNSEIATAST